MIIPLCVAPIFRTAWNDEVLAAFRTAVKVRARKRPEAYSAVSARLSGQGFGTGCLRPPTDHPQAGRCCLIQIAAAVFRTSARALCRDAQSWHFRPSENNETDGPVRFGHSTALTGCRANNNDQPRLCAGCNCRPIEPGTRKKEAPRCPAVSCTAPMPQGPVTSHRPGKPCRRGPIGLLGRHSHDDGTRSGDRPPRGTA